MKLFEPYSPFLKSFQAATRATGGHTDTTICHDGVETLCISFFPINEHGMPFFDLKTSTWESSGSSEETNLMISADQNGRLSLSHGEGGLFFETALRSGSELPEILEFIQTANAETIGESKWIQRTLHSLLDGVYLLPPRQTDYALIPFDGRKIQAQNPNWSFSPLDAATTLTGLEVTETSRDDDLILSPAGTLQALGFYKHDTDSHFSDYPNLVLRPRREVSKMWLSDYMSHAEESAGLAKKIFEEWMTLPTCLREVIIEMPSLKRDQVALSIELRNSKRLYQEEIVKLSAFREPIRKIIPLYRKRIRSVASLHSALIDEIDSMRRPLPFFIEHPFQRFRRAEDPFRKIKLGQHLFDLLAKVPLFLLAEELGQSDFAAATPLLSILRDKPASEGTILEVRRQLAEALPLDEVRNRLKVFTSLHPILAPCDHLRQLLETRNRYHHAPFDEQGFLTALDVCIPALIENLRTACNGIAFIIPKCYQLRAGKNVVLASNISCSDSDFSKITFTTSAAFESFPVDSLVAYCSTNAATVTIRQWITYKPVATASFDFGVFDRMKGNEAVFTYVRDLA